LAYQQQVYDEHRPYYGEKRQHLVQPVSPPTLFSSSPPHHDPHHMVNRETSTRNPSPPPLSQVLLMFVEFWMRNQNQNLIHLYF
jgi:hypothetical protein